MNDSKALAVRPTAIIPTDESGFASMAERFSKSTLIPTALRAKPEDVLVTLMAGNELGFSPMASLRAVHVVQGKPILAADAMVALVLGRGAAKFFRCVSATNESVTYETHRDGDPEPVRETWTIEDATRAGLMGNDNWKKYPRQMLKARCKSVLARDVYPDVLAGCYEEGEREEIERAPFRATATEAVDAEFVEGEKLPEVTAPDPWPAFLAAIEPIAGDVTDGWSADRVLEEVRGVAKEPTSKTAFNNAMKPWHAAIEAAGACPNADRVKAGFRAIYAEGLAAFKKAP